MSGRRLKKNVVADPIVIKNTQHDLANHHIHRKSDAKLTYQESKGKVKIAFQIAEYQSFTNIRIYQALHPDPPISILPELPINNAHVLQLYQFRPPQLRQRWAMFLMDFDPKYGVGFKSEFTLDPFYQEALIQTVEFLVTYVNRKFSDTPKNYFDQSISFQGRTFP